MRVPPPDELPTSLAFAIALCLIVFALGHPVSVVAQHEGHLASRDSTALHVLAAPGLGRVVFPNTGAPAAQEAFLRGVALAHNFSPMRARRAFHEAQRADPGFALAYWLEAYTWRAIPGRGEQPDSARAALRRLGPTPEARLARARTARERAWGAAVEALFAQDSVPGRLGAFADSMRSLVRADSSDVEALVVASFALQSIPRIPLARRGALSAEAAALAERAFRLGPEHPGAAHAVIHVYDTNRLDVARCALAAARAYASIAPDNGHALHMPSHIFLQLGLWAEVEASNRAVLEMQAAERPPVPRELAWRSIDWHSFNWLYFALVQQGRVREALVLEDSAHALLAAALPGAVEAFGGEVSLGPGMRALQFAAVTGDWRAFGRTGPRATPGAIAAMRPREVIWIEAAFLPGLAGAARGDTGAARAAVRRIREEAAREPPGTLRTTRAETWVGEIEGVAAWAAHDTSAALSRLADAAAADDTASTSGPSRWWPARELLGLALLEFGRAGEASDAFAHTLERFPNRPSAQLGLARARLAAGDTVGARTAYAALLEVWRGADATLPELSEARAWAAKR